MLSFKRSVASDWVPNWKGIVTSTRCVKYSVMARLLSVKNVRPAHGGKAGHGKLGNNNIILSTGTMADQQLSSLISANDDPDMAIVRIKSQVSGLGRALRNIGTVSVLHDNTPSVAYDIAQAVVERPINK